MRRTWTANDDAQLRELVAAGLEWPEIAAALNRTVDATRDHASDIRVRLLPETVARINRRAALKRAACPIARANHRAACLTRKRTPETLAMQRANMIKANAKLRASPELQAKRIEALGHGIRRSVAARFAWCPPQYRPQYDSLNRRGFNAAEAKRIVLEQIAKDERRAIALMTPFERELHRVNTGQSRVIVLPPRPAPMQEGRRA